MKFRRSFLVAALAACMPGAAQTFTLTPQGYFSAGGVDVMAFDDIYPEGHQGGVSLLMNGHRVATNGDIRFEPTPGQWQPVPRQLSRTAADGRITATLCYPDSSRHLTGFNPMIYPDFVFTYTVNVEPADDKIIVTVDLDRPVPETFIGKVGFNLELFPGELFGRPWIMDSATGIFPQQPNGPVETAASITAHPGDFHPGGRPEADMRSLIGSGGYSPIVADDIVAAPYAVGQTFTCTPDDPLRRFTVRSLTEPLKLYDGRLNHNNGWFVLRSEVAPGTTKGAVRWEIIPAVDPDWRYAPVVQTSQVGYHPSQPKRAVIETDARTAGVSAASLVRIDSAGETLAKVLTPKVWGKFLRYRYYIADFSDVTEPGLYRVDYGGQHSPVFRIAPDIYERGVWQPVIEYFLPVQMCHMRVNEKYRVWHDRCHMDDARMAAPGNHIDGYNQAPGILPFSPGHEVHGLNCGGWHDAGDFDLRVESQAGECYILSLAYEAFRPDIDVTAIDQRSHTTEIHQPDGRNDILQQIEHGALSVVNSYLALGRLYRGIICPDLRQYVLLGDASAMTDGIPGNADDRRVYTEDNPGRELSTAAYLAATARTLDGFNDTLSRHSLEIARKIFSETEFPGGVAGPKLQAAVELYLTTGEKPYLDYIIAHKDEALRQARSSAWYMARVVKKMEGSKDKAARGFAARYRAKLADVSRSLDEQAALTPYGIPYRPHIWGAGWDIQRFGFEYYFLADAFPEIFRPDPVYDALNFVLGCHPGLNRASFASGVGAQSATVGYGLNRADWSYIPGGVISGTALIRPDFPELLMFPYLWQQTEYVLGGGSSHYMFLVLAARHLLSGN